MALLFVFAAALQYNDPDPLPWIAVYGLAALASLWAGRGTAPRALAALTGVAALGWAAALARGVVAGGQVGAMFGSWRMMEPGVEEAREMLGLLIAAGWMAVLLLRRSGPAPGPADMAKMR